MSEVYHALFLNLMLSNAEFIDMTMRTTLIAVRTVLYAIYASTVYHKEALYRSATTILRWVHFLSLFINFTNYSEMYKIFICTVTDSLFAYSLSLSLSLFLKTKHTTRTTYCTIMYLRACRAPSSQRPCKRFTIHGPMMFFIVVYAKRILRCKAGNAIDQLQ